MTDEIALAAFAAVHPPQTTERVVPPVGDLPASVTELWRTYGPGPYGDRLIRLVDAVMWQAVLDRWIVSPPGEMRRVPFALTPFGTLLYYRRLTATDEDIAALDPIECNSKILSWDLAGFFNETLADPDALDALVPAGMLRAAIETAGPLGPNEVYEVDQTLLAMQMLKITRTDALALHARLRDAIDLAAKPDAPPAGSLDAALPPDHRAAFARVDADLASDANGVGGLYLSIYVDWRRLLALEPGRDPSAGSYRLLFWRNHPKTGQPCEVRSYEGEYEIAEANGDTFVHLAIALRGDSLGSDANDAKLVLMRGGGTRWLLRVFDLATIAKWIDANGSMGRSEYYFRTAGLDAALPDPFSDDVPAPPHAELPIILRACLRGVRR